jgi:hypothetical protein
MANPMAMMTLNARGAPVDATHEALFAGTCEEFFS